jgi:broad specificity phosphatase PhoE
MREVLLIRHAQSEANKERSDIAEGAVHTAIGNTTAQLTPKGIEQSEELAVLLGERYGIEPARYDRPVASSEYTRPQETLVAVGFQKYHLLPILNELEVSDEIIPLLGGRKIIEKHATERWVPDEVYKRAVRFIDMVRSGELGYQIYFSHGLFIAGVKLAAEEFAPQNSYEFSKRGYIPLQAEPTVLRV